MKKLAIIAAVGLVVSTVIAQSNNTACVTKVDGDGYNDGCTDACSSLGCTGTNSVSKKVFVGTCQGMAGISGHTYCACQN
jgi:hypothetical protein